MNLKLTKYKEQLDIKRRSLERARPAVIEVSVSPVHERGSRNHSRDSGKKDENKSPLKIVMPPVSWDQPVKRCRIVFFFDILKDFNADCLNEIYYQHKKKS
jgi:hypothetical protein